MKQKFFKFLIVSILVVAFLGTITGCANQKKTSNEIEVWAGGQWTGTDLQNLKSFINDYNKSNKLGLKVKVTPKSDMESALTTAVRNNKVPDILIWDRFNTPTYSKVDALLDITEYVNRDKIDTNLFNDEAMKELTYNDKYYGLPLDLDVWGLYVNMDMVDSYNDAHPSDKIVLKNDWTWDDLYSISKKLVKYQGDTMSVAGYSGHVMHQHFFKYLTSTGTQFINDDGSPNFDTKQSRDALEFFKKIGSRDSKIWESGLCEKSNFTSNTLAIIDQSLYFTDYIKTYNPNMKFKFMPQPRYSVNGVVQEGAVNGGMLGGFGLAFPKPAEKFRTEEFYDQFEVAWDFAKDWLLSEEMQLNWSEKTATLPALKSLYDKEVIQNNPTLANAASFVSNYKIRPQVPGYLTLQVQVIDTTIKSLTENKLTVEETIQALTNGCEQYID